MAFQHQHDLGTQGTAVSERDIKFRLTYRTLEYAGAKLEACCRM
jgi:hypothetical protein